MKSNFWEEMQIPDQVKIFHKKELCGYSIPDWMQIECPFCKETIAITGLRSFGIRFNTRNFGDLFLEFHCDHCGVMDTVYYRNAAKNTLKDLIPYLLKDWKPETDAVVEEDMYAAMYNNIVERMIKDEHDQKR